MSDTIKEYLVGLGFDVDDASLAKFKGGLATAGAIVTAVGASVVGLSRAVSAFVANQADNLDELADFSELVDESAESVDAWGQVADLADSSAQAYRSSLRGVNEALGQAAQGFPRAKKLFELLNLEARKGNGELKTGTELLEEVGQKIKGLPRPQQLAYLSRLGIDPTLLKTLTGDFGELRAEIFKVNDALGLNIDEAAELGSEYKDTQVRFQAVMQTLYRGIAVRLMPQLIRGANAFRKTLVDNLPTIVRVVTPLLNVILRMGEAFVTLGLRIVSFASTAVTWFDRLNAATNGWAGYVLAAAAAWRFLNLAFLKSPIFWVLALAAAVLLLVDDYLGWQEGAESLVDWNSTLGQTLKALGIVLGIVTAAIVAVRTVMLAWTAVTATWTAVQGAASLAMWAFNAAMAPAVLTVGALILAIGALILVGYDLWKNWDNVWAGYRLFFAWLLGKFTEAGAVVADWANAGAQAVLDAWQGVKDWFAGWFDWLRDKMPSLPSVGDFFGGDGGAALAPAPARASALAGGRVEQNNRTEINIIGQPDAAAAGRAVAREQRGVSSDAQRNLATAVDP